MKNVSATLPELASNALRGVVIAEPGHRLIVADLANIEGRIVAWLAGEEWKLEAFRAYDAGRGPDLYKLAYARPFDVDPDFDHKTIAGYQARQIGKVMELMLSYGGGVGAFITGADTYGIDLSAMAATAWPAIPRDIQLDALAAWAWAVREKRTLGLDEPVYVACDALKRLYRRTNPAIEELWYTFENEAKYAVTGGFHNHTRSAGRVTFDQEKAWLRMLLPSGRYLCYPGARLEGDKLTFLGVNPYSKQWGRMKTWGGTLVENATQALARDVLAAGLLRAELDGMNPVLHVHDEIICEVPEDSPYAAADLERHMTAALPWSAGLPLAAKGFETRRYRKAD